MQNQKRKEFCKTPCFYLSKLCSFECSFILDILLDIEHWTPFINVIAFILVLGYEIFMSAIKLFKQLINIFIVIYKVQVQGNWNMMLDIKRPIKVCSHIFFDVNNVMVSVIPIREIIKSDRALNPSWNLPFFSLKECSKGFPFVYYF